MAAMLEPPPEIKNHDVLHLPVIIPAMSMPFDPATRPLTPNEARVLATLMEKARTVPDSYPLTLNGLVTGCNQKTSREPVMQLTDAEVQEALERCEALSLVFESSGNRTTRWEHNFQRGVGVPDQSAVLLGLLMLRGPQTAGELRINAERWHRFADISSVEAFWTNCASAAPKKAARWSCCCRARPARASRAGRTCCAGRWTPACRLRRPPGPSTGHPCRAPCKSACRRWRPRWPACKPRCAACAHELGLGLA
jgi:hypothetical protein